MDSEKKGTLLQQLADNEKELHELIVEGNKMCKPLEDIVIWLKRLGTEDPLELEFDRGRGGPSVRLNRSSSFEIPGNLEDHIRNVVELQSRIAGTKRELQEGLGMGDYPPYTVSIGKDTD